MKILVASDLHGDVNYTSALVSYFEKNNFDKLYLLGDLLIDSIDILNKIGEKIIAVKGNCDSYQEEELAKFQLPLINYDYQFNRMIVLSHGHYYSPYNYDGHYDIFLFGHTHHSEIRVDKDNRIIANPGSLALPRDGTHSVLIIDEVGIKIVDFNTEYVLNSYKF